MTSAAGRLPDFPDGELGRWAALGDVTHESVRVWVREPAGRATATLSVGGEERARSEVTTDPARDHVGAAVLRLDPPLPGAQFTVDVEGMFRRGRFAPPPGTPSRFTFAFGSCHQPFVTAPGRDQVELHPGTGIYRHMRELLVERGTDFMLLLGDQVYSDGLPGLDLRAMAADPSVTDERLREMYRLLYRAYFNESGIRALAEALPAYLMWDDHDIFDGWGSLLDFGPAEERLYRAAESVFVEYQQLRNPGGELAARPPFGYSFWHGDVGFHVADLRGERSFKDQRVIGVRGWALLDEFLSEASARDVPTVFIGASVPVVHASPMLMRALEGLRIAPGRDVRDRWSVSHFAGERTELVERLFAWQSARPRRQVVVLSGDVHVAAAFSVRRPGSDGAGGAGRGGRFAQWTSSALSTPDGLAHVVVNKLITRFVRVGERELRVRRRGIVTSNNFGLVEVEPLDGGGHAISFGAHQYHARRDRLVETRLDEVRPALHQPS